MAEFPRVKKGHIVPKSYLRHWAVGEQIGMARVGTADRHLISLRDAGTRGPYYRRTTTDGIEIDDAEWSLGHVEDAAAPILRTLEDSWPITFGEKRVLAELFGTQLVRGPRAQEWKEGLFAEAVEEERDAGRFRREAAEAGVSEAEIIREHADQLLDKTAQYLTIVRLSRRATAVLGSMVWSLVRLRSPIVATADHPVVLRPLGESASKPRLSPPEAAALTLEVVVPVSPSAALLMTWLDEPPIRVAPVRASRHHARILNSFVTANAEKQWFFKPGTSPPLTTGALLPLSLELIPGYSEQAARDSGIRHEISSRIADQSERERGMTVEERNALLQSRVIEIVGLDLPDEDPDTALPADS